MNLKGRKMKNQYKAKVKYSSKGKTPDGKPFMRVKIARGYYEYAERGGQDSIAFVLFDNKTKKFCLISESKPPMDERMNKRVHMTTAFGGSIDSDQTAEEICRIEVEEETGYEVTLDRIYYTGKTLVSTQMSQIAKTYLVDVTNIKKTKTAEYEAKPSVEQEAKDATEFSGNSVHWMTIDEVMVNQDWKSVYIAMQAIYRNIIQN